MSRVISLPPKITAQIVRHLVDDEYPNFDTFTNDSERGKLAGNPIASYASVSRKWQAEVERYTFARIHLNHGRLPAAHQYLTPRRWSLVRSVFLRVDLPEYDNAARERVEPLEDQRMNNETFTNVARSVLELLSSGQANGPGIVFGVGAVCKSDGRYEAGSVFMKRKQLRRHGLSKDIVDARYKSSYVELALDDQQLPTVHLISEFHVSRDGRRIAPATCCMMAASMVRLVSLNLELHDSEKNLALRRQLRQGTFIIVMSQDKVTWTHKARFVP